MPDGNVNYYIYTQFNQEEIGAENGTSRPKLIVIAMAVE